MQTSWQKKSFAQTNPQILYATEKSFYHKFRSLFPKLQASNSQNKMAETFGPLTVTSLNKDSYGTFSNDLYFAF